MLIVFFLLFIIFVIFYSIYFLKDGVSKNQVTKCNKVHAISKYVLMEGKKEYKKEEVNIHMLKKRYEKIILSSVALYFGQF